MRNSGNEGILPSPGAGTPPFPVGTNAMAEEQALFGESASTRAAGLAIVSGEPYVEAPADLFIPPEALRVFLQSFEGPLDLLLYLIRRHDVDVMEVPITDICEQYAQYIELMREMQLELAGEYLVMAATLAEIKSRMLVPQLPLEDDDEVDPRAQLFRQLLEYERLKQLAAGLDELPRLERDAMHATADALEERPPRELPQATLNELTLAYARIVERVRFRVGWAVQTEQLSMRERMSDILKQVSGREFTEFTELFAPGEGRMGAAVTFSALLELVRDNGVQAVQNEPYAPIYVTAPGRAKPSAGAPPSDRGEGAAR